MKQGGGTADGAAPARNIASPHHERHLERLIDRLPERLQKIIRWLRRPGLHWVRLVAGVLFIAGSFLSILPIFGIWMLPVGLVLLAEDIPDFGDCVIGCWIGSRGTGLIGLPAAALTAQHLKRAGTA